MFWLQLPMPLWCWIEDLDLMVREYGPFGKGSYLESQDNLENALIEQGRTEGDSQATMGYSRRLYFDLFIILNL